MLITALSILVIGLTLTCICMAVWYGSVHPRYERKFKHQEEQLYRAHLTNKELRNVRDTLHRTIKAIEKDRDEWKHTAYVYYKQGSGKTETITKTVTVNPFTRDELTILIQLCHPDKHGGKPSANAMTQKLNHLRATTK